MDCQTASAKLHQRTTKRLRTGSWLCLTELNMQLLMRFNGDGLTGIINRRRFDQRPAWKWLRALRSRHKLVRADEARNLAESHIHLLFSLPERYGS